MKLAAATGDLGQENRQRYLLWAGYVVFFFFCFFMFAYLTFPYERLRDIIIDRFSSGPDASGAKTAVKIEELSPHWFTGVQLEGVTVTRTADATSEPTVIAIDEVRLRVSPLAYLFDSYEVSFGAEAGEGSLDGTYESDIEGKSKHVVAELDALDLGQMGVGSFLGMPLAGVATGTVDVDIPEEIATSAGDVDLEIAGLVLGDGKNKMKIPGMAGGLTLDPIDAGTLKMKMSIKEGVAAIETFEAKGKDLTLDGSGSLRLATPFDRSRADLTIGFKVEDAYKNKSEKSKIALELMSGNPIMRSATGSDGMTRLQLSGVVSMLRPRPAAPGGSAASKKAAASRSAKGKKGKNTASEEEAEAE
jgi:type II secretion system protein N